MNGNGSESPHFDKQMTDFTIFLGDIAKKFQEVNARVYQNGGYQKYPELQTLKITLDEDMQRPLTSTYTLVQKKAAVTFAWATLRAAVAQHKELFDIPMSVMKPDEPDPSTGK